MKLGGIALVVLVALAACGGGRTNVKYDPAAVNGPAQARWDFDRDPVGGLPPGVTTYSGSWAVRAEAGTPSAPNALCQTGTATLPALTISDAVYADVAVTATFKAISGKEDQAAGLIVRVQDKENFYILRANALENNVNLYRYVGGKRDVIKEGKATVPSGQWQELRLVVRGNHLQGFINEQLVVEGTDDTFMAGKVGLWTKADSETCFDDVEVRLP